MDIDVAMLRALEREKDIPLDVLVDAIEAALLGAYLRTDGAHRAARSAAAGLDHADDAVGG